MDLYDRDIISGEAVREEFNFSNDVESSRIYKEYKKRKNGKVPEKAGAYHDPMWKVALESDLIKNGLLDPTIFGIEVEQKDIVKMNEMPKVSNGRPLNSKDKEKRKPKVVRPRATAENVLETQVWAKESLEKISDIVTPAYVVSKSKAYARDLTNSEVDELENIKLGVLGYHEPFSEITEESIHLACANLVDTSVYKEVREALLERFQEKFNRKPTIEDRRIAAAAAYSLLKS